MNDIKNQVETNIENGVIFIKVGEANRVTHHNTFDCDLADGWIKADYDHKSEVCTIGSTSWEYLPDTNGIREVPAEYFAVNVQANSKKRKIQDVAKSTVTIGSGKVFDGDEKSQDRMVRAINIAEIAGKDKTLWKLADNTTVTVTLYELKEALVLAGEKMGEIWLAE